MTTLTHSLSSTGASSSNSFFSAVFSKIAASLRANKTRKALDMLSDRELEDIGLTRADIFDVAEGRFTRR